MTNDAISLAAAHLANCAGVLADLDGCLWSDGALLPGAQHLARRFPGRLAIVSNNSTHAPAQLASRLRALGLDLPDDHVCLAGALAVEHAAQRWPGARVLVLGTPELTDLAAAAGLMPVHHLPDVILLARDLDLTFERLQAAARAAACGAPVVAANPDPTHPGRDGAVNVETGALLAALRAAVPELDLTVIGKPAPALFAAALRRLGIEAREAVMIGDNLVTDIAGAVAAGIAGILVGRHPDAAAARCSTFSTGPRPAIFNPLLHETTLRRVYYASLARIPDRHSLPDHVRAEPRSAVSRRQQGTPATRDAGPCRRRH